MCDTSLSLSLSLSLSTQQFTSAFCLLSSKGIHFKTLCCCNLFRIVTLSYFQTSLLVVGKVGGYPSGALTGLLSKGRLLSLPASIKQGWKCLIVGNTSLLRSELITFVKKYGSGDVFKTHHILRNLRICTIS